MMGLAAIIIIMFFGVQDDGNYALQAAYDYLFTPDEQAAYDALEKQWDRDRFWDNYWEQRDPTPQTNYNEQQIEFLSRVDFANSLFSQFFDFADGWNSDMGHVYIIFGPPKDIYRSPMGQTPDSKYEVWIYRLWTPDEDERTAELIFEDDDDDGSFDLLTEVEFPRSIQNSVLPKVLQQAKIN